MKRKIHAKYALDRAAGHAREHMSPEMRQIIAAALVVARDQYREDAKANKRADQIRMQQQFERQIEQCETLIFMLEL